MANNHDGRIAAPLRRLHLGFTLLELLVVVGVICVLLAFTIPAIQASREAARRSQCSNNLKQLALGLLNYGDIYKCFPADAVWGNGAAELPQPPYHYPWSAAIEPFIESSPLYDAINKRIAIMQDPANPTQFTGQTSTTVPPAYGANGFLRLQSQQVPAHRCPCDTTLNGPGDMPMNMMWTNYAASEGVGYYPATLVETEDGNFIKSSAPNDHQGLFAFGQWTTFAGVRDGTATTIALAEVTAGSVTNKFAANDKRLTRHATPIVSYTGAIPDPPDWSFGDGGIPPGIPLRGGTGVSRSGLLASRRPETRAPLVFRALWVALTNSVTGGAPCAGGDFYHGALGGPCGGDDGFELHTAPGASPPIYGVAPTYNALYPPNSDWPGPDSMHPGVIIAVFADGHTQTIQQNIDYQIWASLNTRAGSEEVDSDF